MVEGGLAIATLIALAPGSVDDRCRGYRAGRQFGAGFRFVADRGRTG